MDIPELMTPGEVAALFQVNLKTVNRWGNSGRLTVIRTPSGRTRYLAEEVRRSFDYAQRKEVRP